MQVCVVADGQMPRRGTSNSAGFDLYTPNPLRIHPGTSQLVNTKIKIALPTGTYAQVYSRSGLATKLGIHVVAGTIDADYRGFVYVCLENRSNEVRDIEAGDRIAQLILHKINYEPAVQWTHLADDPDLQGRECLPVWYNEDVRKVMMAEIRAVGKHLDPNNREAIDFSQFKITATNRDTPIRQVRGAGGFGSTGTSGNS